MLTHAREALVSLEAIRQAAAARGPGREDAVRGAYPQAARLLADILDDFQWKHPKFDLLLLGDLARRTRSGGP